MMRFLRFFFILLFLATLPAESQDTSSIPEKIRPLLMQRPGLKNRLVAATSKNKITYYLVLELDKTENTQALIIINIAGKAKLVDRLPIIFPLKKYIADEDIIKDLANQYVKFLIDQDLDGVEGIQKIINHNPIAFSPTAPDLIEAYQKAGLKLPLLEENSEKTPPEEEKTKEPEDE